MARSRNLPENAYYEELKQIIDADKEYSDGNESYGEVLQYDSKEGSIEREESDNKQSLNLGRVFETSNENTFSMGHSLRFGRSVEFNRRYFYTNFMNIHFEVIFWESSTAANYKTPNDYFKVNFLSRREGLFNLYVILKPELFYEIAALYPRAYPLILSIVIPYCRGVKAGGW